MRPRRYALLAAAATVAAATAVTATGPASAGPPSPGDASPATTTPIKHLVVIFQENVSFDHYFGTYPNTANPAGEPKFSAAPATPSVNGLSDALLTNNPNLGNPQRLDRSEALTCDQDHDDTAEQNAFDRGAMDQFVQQTGAGLTRGQCDNPTRPSSSNDYAVMDYYDGNTITGLWNYAQHFAMSDNSFSTTFGPSTPGAINVTAANTFGAICGTSDAVYGATACPTQGTVPADPGHPAPQGSGTTYGDDDPYFDVCSSTPTIQQGGANIGDTLSAAGSGSGITWGWFQGGFAGPHYVPGKPSTDTGVCTGRHYNIGAGPSLDGKPCTSGTFCVADYSPHHEPFQYYRSTANPNHTPPPSVAAIGSNSDGGANHQYDLADFWAAVDAGSMPAVSYLKAAKYQDGHAGYSDPLDEQTFLVSTLNALQKSKEWKSTAVVIAYDDSDGWYDHVMGPVTTQSQTALDTLTGTGQCGSNPARVPGPTNNQEARCGYGPRQPLLVISPFAKTNFVDHSLTDQASLVRFIEDNWSLPRLGGGAADALAGSLAGMFDFSQPHGDPDTLILDPSTGEPEH